MALTTYRTFVDSLEALDITGVNRQYEQGPPLNPPTDVPFQYVRYPGADEIPLVFGEQGGWATFRAELIICVEAVGQNTAYENFDDTVDMMDNISTTLRATDCTLANHLRWQIRQIIDTVAGNQYWAVQVIVEGSG